MMTGGVLGAILFAAVVVTLFGFVLYPPVMSLFVLALQPVARMSLRRRSYLLLACHGLIAGIAATIFAFVFDSFEQLVLWVAPVLVICILWFATYATFFHTRERLMHSLEAATLSLTLVILTVGVDTALGYGLVQLIRVA